MHFSFIKQNPNPKGKPNHNPKPNNISKPNTNANIYRYIANNHIPFITSGGFYTKRSTLYLHIIDPDGRFILICYSSIGFGVGHFIHLHQV